MRYNKRPLSIQEQLELLQQRGLNIQNRELAAHFLEHIGYYRLSAYWLPFEQHHTTGNSRNHTFQPNTSFSQIIRLYAFDCELRHLVLEAIERIEISARTQWANALAMKYGAHAHLDKTLFASPHQHDQIVSRLEQDLKNSTETFVVHYRRNYDTPELPPIWAIVETLSFGSLSRWIKSTKDNAIKKSIAQNIGLPTVDSLEKTLHTLTPVRNVCAHHGRLWNRRFAMRPPTIKALRNQMATDRLAANHLYNYALVIGLMMAAIDGTGKWVNQLKGLRGSVWVQSGVFG